MSPKLIRLLPALIFEILFKVTFFFSIIPGLPGCGGGTIGTGGFETSGVIKNEQTGEAISGLVVRISGTNFTATTDKDGRFSILSPLPTNDIVLEISSRLVNGTFRISNIPLNSIGVEVEIFFDPIDNTFESSDPKFQFEEDNNSKESPTPTSTQNDSPNPLQSQQPNPSKGEKSTPTPDPSKDPGSQNGPKFLKFEVSNQKETAANVSVVFDKPAQLSLSINRSSSIRNSSNLTPRALSKSHSIPLTGLSSGSEFQLNATATDELGNVTQSNTIFSTISAGLLVFSDSQRLEVSQVNRDQNQRSNIDQGSNEIRSLNFDLITNRLYWIDYLGAKISFSPTSNFTAQEVPNTNSPKPIAISLDLKNRFLYWLDDEEHKLYRINIDTHSNVETIQTNMPQNIFSIAVDGEINKIYWFKIGTIGVDIQRSDLGETIQKPF